MRRRLLLGLVPFAPLALVSSACSVEPVDIGLVMRAPQGLLDKATSVQLSVFDADRAECSATGHVDKMPEGEGVQRFTLDSTGCTGGAAFCKTITLDKDGSSKMFAVVASNAAGVVAEGCTTATIDQDPLDVDITMQRYNPPGCCNDGVLQSGEQCDSGEASAKDCAGKAGGECKGIVADAVCACDCTAQEILLSVDDQTLPGLKNKPARSKSHLAMTFAPGAAAYPNALRALFTNTGPDAKGGADISERFLRQDLYPITDPPILQNQLALPIKCISTNAKPGTVRKQISPSIAVASSDTVAVVYASDEVTGGKSDIYLSPQNADGCADAHKCTSDGECQTGTCVKSGFNDGLCAPARTLNLPAASFPGAQEPDVAAGGTNAVLAVWTRDHTVRGRIWKTSGALLPPNLEISIAPNASGARVAGETSGWKVVYQGAGQGDGDGIFLRSVSQTGVPGPEVRVNAVTDGVQDQPDIAMLEDGRFIVVWRSAGDIYFQRFGGNGLPIGQDQDHPIHVDTSGDQQRPAAAASVGYGDFFTVAWESVKDGGASNIMARFVGGTSGFRFNSVTGQNDEFSATQASVTGVRHLPAVAIGGGGYVAIGWQDDSDAHPGVYVRRFPLPPSE
ncbi:MAG: hypothetical protein U0359_38075 [Byssovorax sp.]